MLIADPASQGFTPNFYDFCYMLGLQKSALSVDLPSHCNQRRAGLILPTFVFSKPQRVLPTGAAVV
jgi:hypothetical protein